MSSLTVYANEPVTRGKVVVHTSIGPLDIELWPKEAPMACRNFVQLCLEGYYDGCIFHRVIRDFMAQTGDPTGTGKGGESVFGSKFKDEFHSRLRFTHRGLIAMASEGPDTNGSQFFVTLDRCEWLDRKHTIFGKVTGNSLYNLHRFNELEVDAADRPEFAPRIERCEVLLEPFDDIVPRSPAAPAAAAAAAAVAAATAKPRKKEKRNLNLLSFGEEEAAGEAEAAGRPRVLSSHDVLDDPRLSKKSAIEPSANVPDTAPIDVARAPPPRAPHPPPQRPAGGASDTQAADVATDEAAAEAAAEAAFEARMLEQMQAKRQRLQSQSAAAASGGARSGESGGGGSSRAGGGGGGGGDDDDDDGGEAGLSEYDRLKAEMGAERRHELAEAAAEATRRAAGGGGGSGWKWRGKSGVEDEDEDEDEDDEGEGGAPMSELEKQRARFLQKKRESVGLDRKQREKATLAKLAAFQSRGLSHKLDFRAGQAPKMAEAASSYDSFDPLRHGTHEGRAIQKIREREKAMLSMSGSYADDEPG